MPSELILKGKKEQAASLAVKLKKAKMVIFTEYRGISVLDDTNLRNALRKEKHISHFSLREAIDFIREISPKKAFITHISHQMGYHEEVSKELPAEIMLAYDGLSLVCNE